MGRMINPPRAGESIREDILAALDLSVTEAAKQLGVARVARAASSPLSIYLPRPFSLNMRRRPGSSRSENVRRLARDSGSYRYSSGLMAMPFSRQ